MSAKPNQSIDTPELMAAFIADLGNAVNYLSKAQAMLGYAMAIAEKHPTMAMAQKSILSLQAQILTQEAQLAKRRNILQHGTPYGIVSDSTRNNSTPTESAARDLMLALKEMVELYTGLVNSGGAGDIGEWNPETDAAVISARAALRSIPQMGEH